MFSTPDPTKLFQGILIVQDTGRGMISINDYLIYGK